VELGDQVLNLPVRVGVPRDVKGLQSVMGDPALSTAYGLAVYAALSSRSDIPAPMLPVRRSRKRSRIAEWIARAAGFFF